jgi:hypothetical protein
VCSTDYVRGDRVRDQWTADDAAEFGRRVYESVPEVERARWAADLLDLCAIVVEPVPAVDAVVAIGQKPTKADWFAAHQAFQAVRAVTLAVGSATGAKARLRLLLDIAETAAKVIYNASGGSAPFDFHAGWRMAPRLRALVDEVRDHELETRIWRRLTEVQSAERGRRTRG